MWDTKTVDGMERTAKSEADQDCSVKIGDHWLEVSVDASSTTGFKYKWGKNYVSRADAIAVLKMKNN